MEFVNENIRKERMIMSPDWIKATFCWPNVYSVANINDFEENRLLINPTNGYKLSHNGKEGKGFGFVVIQNCVYLKKGEEPDVDFLKSEMKRKNDRIASKAQEAYGLATSDDERTEIMTAAFAYPIQSFREYVRDCNNAELNDGEKSLSMRSNDEINDGTLIEASVLRYDPINYGLVLVDYFTPGALGRGGKSVEGRSSLIDFVRGSFPELGVATA